MDLIEKNKMSANIFKQKREDLLNKIMSQVKFTKISENYTALIG